MNILKNNTKIFMKEKRNLGGNERRTKKKRKGKIELWRD